MRIGNTLVTSLWTTWLFVYFSSKMLWDKIPYVCELLSLAVLAFYAVQFLVARAGQPRHRMVLILTFVIFSVYIVADAVMQSTTQQLLRAVYEYVFYMLMFFAMAWLLPRTDLPRALKIMAVWGVVIALLSWLEFATKSYLISNIVYVPGKNFRATVFTRSFLSHGMILGVFSVICMDIFYREKKLWALFAALFCFVSILTTNSRGPLVAFGAALVLQFLMNSYISQRHSLKRLVASALLSAGALTVLVIMFGTFQTGIAVVDNFLHRIRSILDWEGDAGNVGRLEYWNQAIVWFKSNIWFGIGPSKTGSWGSGAIGVTESGVLKRLCELGLIGFTLFYYFLARVVYKGIKRYKYASNATKQRLTFFFALATAMLINDCTLQSTEEIMIAFFLWVAFAGIEVTEDGPDKSLETA